MSIYCDLSSTIKLDFSQPEKDTSRQKTMPKENMKIQYNFQNNQLLEIQNENRQLRQKLAKKEEYITYMSIKSIEMAKQYMRVLAVVDEIEQQKKIQEKKLDKLIKKVQKYKNQKQINLYKIQQLQQKIHIFQLNKQSLEDKFQSQIENIKTKNQQGIQKMQDLKTLTMSNPELKIKIQRIINQITDIIKVQ